MFEPFAHVPPRPVMPGRILGFHARRREAPREQASSRPEPAGNDADRIAVHIPLLEGATARLEHLESQVVSRLHGGHKAGTGAPPQPPKVIVDLPSSHPAHHFFGNPIAAVEASCARVVRGLVWEAGRAFTHIACRGAGATSFAAVGLWAGRAHLRRHPSLFNPAGHAHPALGWTLLALSLPLPLFPTIGTAVGEQAARLICWGLEPPPDAPGGRAS